MKKRIVLVLSVIMMCSSSMPAFAAEILSTQIITEGEEGAEVLTYKTADETAVSGTLNGLTWTFDENKKTVTLTGEASNFSLKGLPSSVSKAEHYIFKNCKFSGSLKELFYKNSAVKSVQFVDCNMTNVTNIFRMFYGCMKLQSVDVSDFDTTNVTDMSGMFANCGSLQNLDVSNFDTTNVTDMSGMFYACRKLQSLDVSNFNTTNVTDMSEMFASCYKLQSLDVNNFDTTNVTNMSEMFKDCISLQSLDLSNFNTTNVTDMSAMFCMITDEDSNSLQSLDLSNFNTTNVTDMSDMFENCNSLQSLNLSHFDTSNVESMSNMFGCCDSLKSLDISHFNTSKVTNMQSMFANCRNLTSLNISHFNTSKVSSIDRMFEGCNSLQSLDMSNFELMSLNNEAYLMLDRCNKLKTIHTPKKIPENISIELPFEYKTLTGKVISKCTAEHVGMILTRCKVSAPKKPYKITNVVSGIHVYWNAPDGGASKYGLWRSETGKNGTYKWIANPTVAHFTDTKVESGKTYYYKVTILDTQTNEHSEQSEAIGIIYTSSPDITSRVNKEAGVQLGWKKVAGATGYGIYRKSYTGNDGWVRIATINSGDTLSYVDSSVKGKNGEVYRYTIRALAGADKNILSGCRNTGRTVARLASRTLNSAVNAGKSAIKCSWTTSSAVTGYEVRFMVGSKVYKTVKVENYKTGTKTFTGLTPGRKYKIQVRSYKNVDGVGSFYSAWSLGKTVTLP